jgi:hypothetical protein
MNFYLQGRKIPAAQDYERPSVEVLHLACTQLIAQPLLIGPRVAASLDLPFSILPRYLAATSQNSGLFNNSNAPY